jgi:cystathionine gamma-synthase
MRDCYNEDEDQGQNNTWHPSTHIARAGVDSRDIHGAVIPPLYLSSNYTFEGFGKKRPYDYTRSGNPTRDTLGDALAGLEGGAGAVITSSGMSALDVVFQLLGKDDVLIAPHDCYGGTHRLLSFRAEQGHFRVKFVNLSDTEALATAFEEKVTLVLIETPSNPLLRLTDIRAVAAQAQKHDTLVAVDNTFLSPILQKPISLGADIVIHSTTKFINGHSDVVGGAVISKTPELHDKIKWLANCTGVTGAPFDSFLTLRGLRTLALRQHAQESTARAIAQFLSEHPAVEKVYYPGLKTHPGHDIAVRQQQGFGSMISFELAHSAENIRTFLSDISAGPQALFCLAESLGGFESLIAHPATMTHASMDPVARINAGIRDNLLRLSIGLEDETDLLTCLKSALDRVADQTAVIQQTAA